MLVVVKPVLIFDCISIDEIQIGKSRLSSMDWQFHWQHMAQRGQSSPSAELRRSLWALGWRIRQARCFLLISVALDFWQNGSDTSLKPLVMSTELRFCPKGSSVKCTGGGIYALRRLQLKLKHILLHLILIIRRRQIKKSMGLIIFNGFCSLGLPHTQIIE